MDNALMHPVDVGIAATAWRARSGGPAVFPPVNGWRRGARTVPWARLKKFAFVVATESSDYSMDVKVILRGSMTGQQRIGRHLTRMCAAFFLAAGSFFVGQQKVMFSGLRPWHSWYSG
jgi:hypothetical protein